MIGKCFKNFLVLLVLCSLLGCDSRPVSSTSVSVTALHRDDAKEIFLAFQNHQSNLLVESKGKVVEILPDDLKGSRHQRFILQLPQQQTILVAHNIDIASRVNNLVVGDEVYFSGEYEWSRQGGVIHWTHHDPQYRHAGGWLEHKGVRYE
jgi:hypothetical protein